MKSKHSYSWIYSINASIVLLLILIFANFYGTLTDRFYFNKIENYLFPVLTVVHFIYMYAIKYKIRENEYPDVQMRNLEYFLYVVVGYYIYKVFILAEVLFAYSMSIEDIILPITFLPVTIFTIVGYLSLSLLTFHLMYTRKKEIGSYQIDYFSEENLDTWP